MLQNLTQVHFRKGEQLCGEEEIYQAAQTQLHRHWLPNAEIITNQAPLEGSLLNRQQKNGRNVTLFCEKPKKRGKALGLC